MKKQTKIKLSIPTPCNENWEDMTPNERGRHCASCDKTVIDFSLYTDKQLIEFFTKATGRICGRVSNLQLERQVVYTEPQNHFLYKLLFGSALTIGLAGSANANYNPNQRPLIEQYTAHKETIENTEVDYTRKFVQGVITDSANKASLPFATVMLTHNGKCIDTAYTDIDGKYKFNIPDSLQKSSLVVSVTYPGYRDLHYEFIPSETKTDINLIMAGSELFLHTVGMMIYEPLPDPTKQTIRKGDTPFR